MPSRYLHGRAFEPIAAAARGPGGRVACRCTEESPGSTETRCRVTPGGPGSPGSGKVPQRADRPLVFGLRARVKGCGKSAPRDRQRKRHGKPHPEQDRIGTARSSEQACFGPAVRVDCLSVPATVRLEEWLPAAIRSCMGYRRRYRTRLTGPLALRWFPTVLQVVRTFPCLAATIITTSNMIMGTPMIIIMVTATPQPASDAPSR